MSGCIDGNVDDALELSSTTTDGEEAERPEPTTGTGTTGTTTTTTGDSTSSATSSGSEHEIQPLEVELSLSHSEISQARSVVLTITSKGADTVKLAIFETKEVGLVLNEVELPTGKTEYEHKVLLGSGYYVAIAGRDGEWVSDFEAIEANLPDPGTFEQTLGPQGTGAAIVLHTNEGTALDQPTVIGHDLEGNVVFLGQPSPYLGAGPMEVTSAVMDDYGVIYVGGSADGQAVVRKYKNRHLYWEYATGTGIVHDIILLSNHVVAVGEVEHEGVTSGAYWRLSESGGLAKHHVWEGTDEQNEPLGSIFNSVADTNDGPVIVGSVVGVGMDTNKRAAVFDGDSFSMCDVVPVGEHATSTWLGIAGGAHSGFVTVGFQQDLDEKPRIRRSTFAECNGPQGLFVGADGRGRDTFAATTFVGEELLDGEPHTYVENSSWNHRGGPGTGAELAVDRHGYVHVAGTVSVNGESRIALTTFHP